MRVYDDILRASRLRLREGLMLICRAKDGAPLSLRYFMSYEALFDAAMTARCRVCQHAMLPPEEIFAFVATSELRFTCDAKDAPPCACRHATPRVS